VIEILKLLLNVATNIFSVTVDRKALAAGLAFFIARAQRNDDFLSTSGQESAVNFLLKFSSISTGYKIS